MIKENNKNNNTLEFNILNETELKSKSKVLIESLKNNSKELHLLLCQHLEHFYKCGDYTLLTKFIDDLPKTIRKSDVIFWTKTFGAFNYNVKDGLTYNAETMAKNKPDYINILNKAYKMPFYELRKDKPVINKTFLDILKDVQKTLEYDLNKRKESRYSVDDLKDINALIAKREKTQSK